jgi:hypothetical protein
MSVGNLATQGDKKNNWTWQNAVLQLLGQIATSTGAGSDYETRTTSYQAIASGPGYSIGDIIVRYDIITMPGGVVASTVWFNQTLQTVIAPPTPANLTPVQASSSVTVVNPPGALAVNIQDGGNSITIDNANLDAAISTLLSRSDFQARINTLGQKAMAASTPVVLASDQSSIPVTLPAGVSRVPSVQLIPANTGLSNTVAGKKQVSMRVSGGNGQIGGVAIPNGITLTYTATSENDTVGAISYQTGAGTTILITYLT